MLVDTFAQAYHWSVDQILTLTVPQIVLLNHAAEFNRTRLDRKLEKGRKSGTLSLKEQIADAPMWNGKRVNELTSEEYAAYVQSGMED